MVLSSAAGVSQEVDGGPSITRRHHRSRIENISWLPFVLPGLGLFAIFELWPLLQAVVLSFYNWDGYSPKVFVGLGNYTRALGDPALWNSLGHAAFYTLGTVAGKMLLGLALALLLHRSMAGRAFYRSIIFAPALMSFIAVGLLWGLIYSPQQGLLNQVLGLVGLPADVNWLGDPNIALLSLVIVDVWKYTGYHAVIFLAGLTMVQKELLEAAAVDGASWWQRFWHVTLPALRSVAIVNLVIMTAGALNTFDVVFVMTNGGPFGSTNMPILYMYTTGFSNSRLGYASAIACLMFILVGLVTAVLLRFQRAKWERS